MCKSVISHKGKSPTHTHPFLYFSLTEAKTQDTHTHPFPVLFTYRSQDTRHPHTHTPLSCTFHIQKPRHKTHTHMEEVASLAKKRFRFTS